MAAADGISVPSLALELEERLKREAASWAPPADASSIPLATDVDMPVLDLGAFFATNRVDELERAAAALRVVGEQVGFHLVVGHGVPEEVIDGAFGAARAFHALPAADKQACAMGQHGVGYLPVGHRKLPARDTGNTNEAFVVKHEPGPRDVRLEHAPWPAPLGAGFRAAVERFCAEMCALCVRMLPLYAVALGLAPSFFARAFERPMYRARLTHYPPTPAGAFGIHPHVDTSFVTVLAASSPGLVFYSARTQRWVRARAVPGALVVNTGQLLAQLTNDRWMATRHYVLNAPAEGAADAAADAPPQPGSDSAARDAEQQRTPPARYALPFFFNATPTVRMAVVPTCCSADDPPRYPPTSYLEGQGVAQGE